MWGAKADEKKVLKKEGLFKPLAEVAKKRELKIGVWGDKETSKTHFILTCPEPIYVIDTEFGVAPLWHRFKDRDIKVLETFIEDPETGKTDPIKSLERVEEAVNSLKDVKEGTIAIDSGSDIWFWEEVRMKEIVGEIGRKTMQFDWKIANKHYGELIMKLISRKVVFVISARPREIYTGATATGMYEPRWQNQTAFWTDVIIKMEKLRYGTPSKADEPSTKTRYIGTITKCRYERQFDKKIEDITYDKLYEVLKKYL